MSGPRGASEATRRALEAVAEELPAEDGVDARSAERGFLAGPERLVIRDDADNVVWDMGAYEFLREGAGTPDTVHPSLWRHASIDTRPGLYEVCEGVCQVRGYDISNMTLLEGDSGVLVVDPLISVECAAAALELYRSARGEREVTGIVYSHSHVDHFGGVKGVVSQERVDSDEIPVIAPDGFLEHAVSENVLAGPAMARRTAYMFGSFLERGPRGQIGSGVGWGPSNGTYSLIPPTDMITETGAEREIDGIRLVFQLVPETEAPAELNFHLPDRRALYVAEIATHTHHNLLTLRGAQVRDALAWSKYLNETLELFGAHSDVVFHGHHWPTWGGEELAAMLARHRDLYRYMHDQTLRLMARGRTPTEIAAEIELPPALRETWSCRPYYGTVSHNVRAVYQRYLGYFDGVPAHLDPLPVTESAQRYVELAGGAAALAERAREALARGDYRWAAELANHLVFADPEGSDGAEIGADALEQLGYQAESAIWRNYLLAGAGELREGVKGGRSPEKAGQDVARRLPLEMVFDAMGTRLNGRKAWDARIVVNWELTDLDERWVLTVENGTLNAIGGRLADDADVTITLTRGALHSLMLGGPVAAAREYAARRIKLSGKRRKVLELLELLDEPDYSFEIVRP